MRISLQTDKFLLKLCILNMELKEMNLIMRKKLDEYNRKRNFEKTIEPEVKPKHPKGAVKESDGAAKGQPGKTDDPKMNRDEYAGEAQEPEEKPDGSDGESQKPEEMPRFVVQHHIASRDHFDFRLEWDGALLSWAVPKGPSYNTRDKRLAVQVEDHPLEYRNFEGTIPKGEYGGGTVMLWDEGWWIPQADVDKGLDEGSLKFVLKGRRLKGRWALVRLKANEGDTKNNWLLLKEKDEYAQTTDEISEFSTSIRTGRTMAEIENGEEDKISITYNPFKKAGVQLAKLVKKIPEGDDWLFELKYDGYRIIAYIEDNSARLITRNGHDYTKKFHDITYSLIDWAAGRSMVLDGEMVVSDTEGRTDFQALQSYMKNPREKKLTYIVFDLLALEGKDLRGRSLIERKELLEAIMKDSPSNLYYSKHIRGNGKASFMAACEKNLEGIIGKRVDSLYSGTRNSDWIKLKCDSRQELVIGGYTLSDKKTSGVSSLLLGVYEGEELIYAGRAGTGFTERSMKELERRFQAIKIEASPFKATPAAKKNERITWLRPVLVAEIKFAEWTDENLLRQASFKGLRADKDPIDVKREGLSNELSEEKGIQTDDEMQISDRIRNDKQMDDRPLSDGEAEISKIKASNKKVKEKRPAEGKMRNRLVREKAQDESDEEQKVPLGSIEEKPVQGKMTGEPDFEMQFSQNGKSVSIGGIKITNPARVVFDDMDIKKVDVVQYYASVSERMMPYAGGRILSVVRCHKGISETCFFKKHPGNDNKGIVTIPVANSSGEKKEYFYIENAFGLISEAQMGTLEFHTWGSRADELEKPDIMVFDLDPDEGMELERVRQGVSDLRSLLDQLSLVSYLKTSGGKGYHVVVPFLPSVDWDAFSGFARQIAEIMEQKWPDRYTSNVRKDKRKGRIFIDWIRNGRGATSIAPYSLRARKGARVSMPITWEELDTVAPDGIGIDDALKRIDSTDPWKNFFQTDQRLK